MASSTSNCVLIVDDDDSIRSFVSIALTDEGYDVATAPHGAAALRVIDETPPALILLDMRMPIMDGWGFAQAYQQTVKPHAPIVAMTAARDAATSAAQINANAYLSKPFSLEDLLVLVHQFVPGVS